jgi:hypothetical protein
MLIEGCNADLENDACHGVEKGRELAKVCIYVDSRNIGAVEI